MYVTYCFFVRTKVNSVVKKRWTTKYYKKIQQYVHEVKYITSVYLRSRQGEESMIILLIIISLIMMGMSFAIYNHHARANNMTGCIDQASVDLASSTCSQTRPFLLPFP